jgi:DNA-binding winged helix-turn-helix (wHTH) protein/Tfp pilus assembly protein PilF
MSRIAGVSASPTPRLWFDDFCLDPVQRLLTRDGHDLTLSPHLVDILEYLAVRQGQVVTKNELLDRFWPEVHVTDNALTRAIADIRKVLGDDASRPRYIQTAARRGYRFVAQSISESQTDHHELFRDFVRGRAALEALDATRLAEAVTAFEQAAEAMPHYAPAHVRLASARLMQYEATRATGTPRRDWLQQAVVHARRACALDPKFGEAWATLGFVLTAAGQGDEARAAARQATAIEPDNWRHQSRVSVTTWGEERLRACARTRELLPDFAPTRFAAAMVFVARQAFVPALHEAEAGATTQSRQIACDGAFFPAIGLHWLRGVLLLRDGHAAAALQSFARELEGLRDHQIYAREFRVNAEVGAGFAHLAAGDSAAAVEAFRRALALHPRGGRALVGVYRAMSQQRRAAEAKKTLLEIDRAIEELTAAGRPGEATLIAAVAQAARGDDDGACATIASLLAQAPPGHVGWLIPIDPAFAPLRLHSRFAEVSALLSARAT